MCWFGPGVGNKFYRGLVGTIFSSWISLNKSRINTRIRYPKTAFPSKFRFVFICLFLYLRFHCFSWTMSDKAVLKSDECSGPFFAYTVFYDAPLVPANRCGFETLKHFDRGFQSGSWYRYLQASMMMRPCDELIPHPGTPTTCTE
jgi:hypothetical protein